MLKTHSQVSKDTIVGIGLFTGVFLLFFVNLYFVFTFLIQVYGANKTSVGAGTIDDTTLSQAVQALDSGTSQ